MQGKYLKEIFKGHRSACEAAICQHYGAIYNFMLYLTNNVNLAEDLTQETFAWAWAKAGSFKGRATLKTWLFQIAYHKFIDLRRKVKRDSELDTNLKADRRRPEDDLNPLQQLANDEEQRLLYEAIGELESNESVMIVLHYIQSLSFRQVGKILGEPTGTVKWRTYKALKKLRTILIGRV